MLPLLKKIWKSPNNKKIAIKNKNHNLANKKIQTFKPKSASWRLWDIPVKNALNIYLKPMETSRKLLLASALKGDHKAKS